MIISIRLTSLDLLSYRLRLLLKPENFPRNLEISYQISSPKLCTSHCSGSPAQTEEADDVRGTEEREARRERERVRVPGRPQQVQHDAAALVAAAAGRHSSTHTAHRSRSERRVSAQCAVHSAQCAAWWWASR